MNNEEKILNEFLDFRNYVSHTLCKNRLFLYLNSKNAETALKSLSEPSVWSILKVEIESLFNLGPQLYGINCPAVFVDEKDSIEKAVVAIDKIISRDTDSLNNLMENSVIIRTILENVKQKFLTEPFELEISSVEKYLANKSADSIKVEVRDYIKNNILPLIEDSDGGLTMSQENTYKYWSFYPPVMLSLRECLISGILHDKDDGFISDTKNLMYAIMKCDLQTLMQPGS
ncbi:MAG: hypothetical protein HQK94_16675 [Nitrospirae bacterium]|nr:hypothetical protein [Nitrospirota bacterium]